MDQLQLSLLGCLSGPGAVPAAEIEKLRTYREAVCMAWALRRVKGMTNATLAERTGMRPSHISDYLSAAAFDKNGKERREMPAKYLPAFEAAAGNTLVTQWLLMQSQRAVQEALAVAA